LQAGWDTYGAPPIDEDCLGGAVASLKQIIGWRREQELMVEAPFVAPMSNGGVQLEWEKEGKYLEVHVEPEPPHPTFLAVAETPGGEISEEGVVDSESAFKDLLSWVASGTADELKKFEGVREMPDWNRMRGSCSYAA
jgi:hypothetical protein